MPVVAVQVSIYFQVKITLVCVWGPYPHHHLSQRLKIVYIDAALLPPVPQSLPFYGKYTFCSDSKLL